MSDQIHVLAALDYICARYRCLRILIEQGDLEAAKVFVKEQQQIYAEEDRLILVHHEELRKLFGSIIGD